MITEKECRSIRALGHMQAAVSIMEQFECRSEDIQIRTVWETASQLARKAALMQWGEIEDLVSQEHKYAKKNKNG